MATTRQTASITTHQTNFTQFPNAVLKNSQLSFGARTLYGLLLSYCYQKDYCYPSYDTLQRDLGCHSQALSKYIKELLTHDLIRVIRPGQGRTNIYIITQREQARGTALPPAEDAATVSPVHTSEPALRKSQTEEYREEEYTYISSDEEIYDSSNRIGEGSQDYVNFPGHPAPPEPIHSPAPVSEETDSKIGRASCRERV